MMSTYSANCSSLESRDDYCVRMDMSLSSWQCSKKRTITRKASALSLRLLFVVNESYFFLTHRLALAKAAQKAGYEVHVAAPSDHVWAPNGFSIEELRSAGFEFHEIPLSRRGKNPLQDLATLIALIRLFYLLKPDVLHLLTIKPVVYGGIASRIAGLRAVVSTITGLGQVFIAKGVLASVLRWLVIRLYRLATNQKNARIIVQNRGDQHTIISTGAVARDKIHLIRGSGVAMDIFRYSLDKAVSPVVILPSRLIWEKGVGIFADAAKILKEEGINARFALVGDTQSSNPRAVPAATIEGWVGSGVLEWWGRRTDMPEVYREASIVCLPSMYGEGVPKVLIEASASGRAIVTSDNPGCTEIVDDGVNGLVVPTNDPEALAVALKRLIQNTEERQTMGQRGREIVVSGFSEDQVTRETLGVYKKAMDMGSF
jgi:glycosyltransferase involved in cell wall biosynthesis